MLSEVDKRFLGEITNWAYLWGGSPFVWNRKKERLHLTTSAFGYIKHLIQVYGWFVYLAFLLYRCLDSVYRERPLVEYNMCFVFLVCGGIPGIVMLVLTIKEKEILLFVNSSVRMSDWISAEYGESEIEMTKVVKWLSRLLKLIYVFTRSYGVGVAFITLTRPYDIVMPASVVPTIFRGYFIVILQSSIATIASLAAGGAIAGILAWIIILSIAFFHAQNQINLKHQRFWTKSSLRTTRGLKSMYTTSAIVFQLTENFIRDIIMPLQMIITRSVHICNFILFRHHDQLPWIDFLLISSFSVVSTVIWLGMMQCAALIYKSTKETLGTWKNCPVESKWEAKIWKKSRLSFRPLRIMAGDFYVVKHKTVMNIGTVFIRGTMRILLIGKKRKH